MNEFQKVERAKKERLVASKCKFCAGVMALPKGKRKDLYDAILDPDITLDTILNVLISWQVDTSMTAVNHHSIGAQRTNHYTSHIERLKASIA